MAASVAGDPVRNKTFAVMIRPVAVARTFDPDADRVRYRITFSSTRAPSQCRILYASDIIARLVLLRPLDGHLQIR